MSINLIVESQWWTSNLFTKCDNRSETPCAFPISTESSTGETATRKWQMNWIAKWQNWHPFCAECVTCHKSNSEASGRKKSNKSDTPKSSNVWRLKVFHYFMFTASKIRAACKTLTLTLLVMRGHQLCKSIRKVHWRHELTLVTLCEVYIFSVSP